MFTHCFEPNNAGTDHVRLVCMWRGQSSRLCVFEEPWDVPSHGSSMLFYWQRLG